MSGSPTRDGLAIFLSLSVTSTFAGFSHFPFLDYFLIKKISHSNEFLRAFMHSFLLSLRHQLIKRTQLARLHNAFITHLWKS